MSVVESILELLYPERCAACDAILDAPAGMCAACAASLYPLGTACPICAEPQETLAPVVCGRCRAKPPPFDRVVAPWRYGGELATALRRFKYGGPRRSGRGELARPLARVLLRGVGPPEPIDRIVPVPLSATRMRARGFSQARLLATEVRRLAGVRAPVDALALRRTRDTAEQAGLTRVERARNVHGAFAVPPPALDRVLGARVLLVDDVVTTGATAAACARALRTAGAHAVIVLALARAES
jgi:ComF family protein